MKLAQKIFPNDILDDFKNDNICLKNIAAKGRGISPYITMVKPF